MSNLAPTFDESWHRVSPRRIRLRPGVEIFPRRVFQQKGRGYFAELTRLDEGTLDRIGLAMRSRRGVVALTAAIAPQR